jgi:sugar lactone lactonase YvrE
MDGALTGAGSANGHLYLVDHRTKRWQVAFPGDAPAFRQDETRYAGCPGPLNTRNFSAHGLALKGQSRGRHLLYVVGHGDREAIEVFEVDARGPTPAFTWVGCVVLPDDVSANSVAILPDGGFIATKFLDRTLPQAESMAQARQGKLNGALFEWHPGGKVAAIPGTELSAPNGIEVSPDGRTIYVAVFGTHEFVRFRRERGGITKAAVPVALSPDNVRWTESGKLLTTGGDYAGPDAPRATGWTVLEIDPDTLATRPVARGASSKGMQALSVALQVDGTLWVGTFAGDRVGYVGAR